jgi:hypothetical protein
MAKGVPTISDSKAVLREENPKRARLEVMAEISGGQFQ